MKTQNQICWKIFLFSILAVMQSSGNDTVAIPDGIISGHVYDVDTKQPLSQAFVYCQDVKCSKPTTNNTGYYATDPCFSPYKTYTIQCTRHEYKTAAKSVTTDQDGKVVANFNLEAEEAKSSGNQHPVIVSLTPDKSSPQSEGTIITWTAKATDPENDPILYEFFQNGIAVTDWIPNNMWTNCGGSALSPGYACGNGSVPNVGDNQIEVRVRDGKHAGDQGSDDSRSADFVITGSKPSFVPIENVSSSARQPSVRGIWSVTGILDEQITMALRQDDSGALSGEAKYEPESGTSWNAIAIGSISGRKVHVVLENNNSTEIFPIKLDGTYGNETITGAFIEGTSSQISKRREFTATLVNPEISEYLPAMAAETSATKHKPVGVREYTDKLGPGGDLSGVPPSRN